MRRQTDGSFADDDIAKILQDATDKVAGAYRARGTPSALRVIEILGIEQARAWGVCTMNEFRQFLGLKQFESFEEWNSDPEIAVCLFFPTCCLYCSILGCSPLWLQCGRG